MDDAYMFGSDLLVAPVMERDVVSRKVYLPKGCSWTESHTGRVLEGGQIVIAKAPVDVIPVFIREGSNLDLRL